ncbi:MAG: hypothetical protein ACT452_14940 [Microthrixaceae bacterium]
MSRLVGLVLEPAKDARLDAVELGRGDAIERRVSATVDECSCLLCVLAEEGRFSGREKSAGAVTVVSRTIGDRTPSGECVAVPA